MMEPVQRARRELEQARVAYDDRFQDQCLRVRQAELAVRAFQRAEKRLLDAERAYEDAQRRDRERVDAVIDVTRRPAVVEETVIDGGDAAAANGHYVATGATRPPDIPHPTPHPPMDPNTPAKNREDEDELLGTIDFVSPAPLQLLGRRDDVSESRSRLTGSWPVGMASVVVSDESRARATRKDSASDEDGIVPVAAGTSQGLFFDLTPVQRRNAAERRVSSEVAGDDASRGGTTASESVRRATEVRNQDAVGNSNSESCGSWIKRRRGTERRWKRDDAGSRQEVANVAEGSSSKRARQGDSGSARLDDGEWLKTPNPTVESSAKRGDSTKPSDVQQLGEEVRRKSEVVDANKTQVESSPKREENPECSDAMKVAEESMDKSNEMMVTNDGKSSRVRRRKRPAKKAKTEADRVDQTTPTPPPTKKRPREVVSEEVKEEAKEENIEQSATQQQSGGRRSRRARKPVSYNYDGPRSDIVVTDPKLVDDVDWDELKGTMPGRKELSARKRRRVSSSMRK